LQESSLNSAAEHVGFGMMGEGVLME
jgi:hypothetical protein